MYGRQSQLGRELITNPWKQKDATSTPHPGGSRGPGCADKPLVEASGPCQKASNDDSKSA